MEREIIKNIAHDSMPELERQKEHTIIWRNKLKDKFSVPENDIERLAQKAVSSLFDKVNNDRSYLGQEFIDQIILSIFNARFQRKGV